MDIQPNYLQWLTQETPTKWWHDSAIPSEIDEAIANGALGVTTNPVLTFKSLQAAPDFWQPQVEQIPQDLPPTERAEALLKLIATYAAAKFRPVFDRTGGKHGYALGAAQSRHLQRFRQDAGAGAALPLLGRQRGSQVTHGKGGSAGYRGIGCSRHSGVHNA